MSIIVNDQSIHSVSNILYENHYLESQIIPTLPSIQVIKFNIFEPVISKQHYFPT